MKINISRQHIYLLVLSVILFLIVLLFSFFVLIPQGKEYRANKLSLRMERIQKQKYQNFYDEVYKKLKQLQSDNRRIIVAFDTKFSVEKFKKNYQSYFHTLSIKPYKKAKKYNDFTLYEVNATSHISTPKTFYKFLDALNKSDWIVEVNFPIEFKKEDEYIRSSFTMKVYHRKRVKETTPLKQN